MKYTVNDIDELIEYCDKLHGYIKNQGNIYGTEPVYQIFKQMIISFENKYENYFMNKNYAPYGVIEWFFQCHKFWSPSDVDTIKTILNQIKQDHFPQAIIVQNTFDPWDLINFSIISHSKQKYLDGHYADAVESAMKSVNSRIKSIYKKQTGEELDGVKLMRKVFLPSNPVLKFEDISTESGQNVQEGYMQMFAGAIQGLRNPKAHDNLYITKENAMKQLIFASFLMDKIDEALRYTEISEF